MIFAGLTGEITVVHSATKHLRGGSAPRQRSWRPSSRSNLAKPSAGSHTVEASYLTICARFVQNCRVDRGRNPGPIPAAVTRRPERRKMQRRPKRCKTPHISQAILTPEFRHSYQRGSPMISIWWTFFAFVAGGCSGLMLFALMQTANDPAVGAVRCQPIDTLGEQMRRRSIS